MSSGWNGGEDHVSGLPATAVLEAARDAQQKTWEGDVHLLRAAAEWAAAHPEEMLPTEWDHDPGLETDVPIAGPGAPTMCEFAISEFGGGVIPDRRHADLDERHVGSDGTLYLDADLDLAGGLDLNHVLTHRAEELKALGSTDSLDVRRAIALCDLARTQTALDLTLGTHQTPATTDDLPPARRLDLTLHLQASVDEDGTVVVDPVATLERNGGIVLIRRTVEAWCRGSRTEVRVLPVLDLNTPRTSPGYRPSPLLQRQVRFRDGTATSPGANDQPQAATWTTSNRMTPTPTGTAHHRPGTTTSPPPAGVITG